MTQDERDAILGRTRRQYLNSRSELGALKQRHAEFVAEVRKFLSALDQEALSMYASPAAKGALQFSMEMPGARFVYDASLADRLSVEAMGAYLDEYREVFERVESLRKSLVSQGDDDPGPAE
jgi:hypothetical protein